MAIHFKQELLRRMYHFQTLAQQLTSPERIRGREDIVAWLDSRGIDQIVIISPHLDDAVFSLHGLISAVPEITEVVTVHTEGSPDVAAGWAHAAGFADRLEEHAARRREDERAMEHIGCRFRHLGVRSGELSEAVADHFTKTLWGSAAVRAASMLILLPAGAGSDRLISPAKRWVRRILRQRVWMAHPEHESTRDFFCKALSAIPLQLGFYADVPYSRHVAPTQLAGHLSELYLNSLEHVQIKPDPAKKRFAAEFYASQVEVLFGGKMSYRRRLLNSEEHLFLLPKHDARVSCAPPTSTAKSPSVPISSVLQT